jgi:uncharacterized RDD family membrane protein YckC
MKAKDFRWFLLGYCALLIIALTLHSDETIGVNADWSNGQYSYRAGSAPWAISFAVVGAVLYILLQCSKVVASTRRMPHLFLRWTAGLVDFVLAIVVPSTFIGFAAVISEYRRTGAFDWLVERQEQQPGDWPFAVASVLLLMFVVAPSYFAFPWWRGKPTPGSCIFGFRIVADEGTRLHFWQAGLRALLGSMALLAWPCWILAYWVKRDKSEGKFWLDAVFGTHAEFFE